MAKKIRPLSPLQLHCIRYIHTRIIVNKGDAPSTHQIGDSIPDELVRAWTEVDDTRPIERIRDTLISNGLGPTLAVLARTGYLVRIPNVPRTNGISSFWRLGPMSDKLIEDGVLS
jgi:hypothetical protein